MTKRQKKRAALTRSNLEQQVHFLNQLPVRYLDREATIPVLFGHPDYADAPFERQFVVTGKA